MKENVLMNELKSTIWTIMLGRGMRNLTCICTLLLDNSCQIVADHDCSEPDEEKQKIDLFCVIMWH